jgi:hypothetical protein
LREEAWFSPSFFSPLNETRFVCPIVQQYDERIMEGGGDGERENLVDTPTVPSYDVQADSLGKFYNLIWISRIALAAMAGDVPGSLR